VESTIGWRGTLVFLGIYAALGLPEIKQCLANGGEFGACAITGVLIGGLKVGLYILIAVLTGLAHLVFK
jgi:hypothetical protein